MYRLLKHEIEVDRRHAPDYSLGSTATDCALRQFSRAKE
jgi:hypothetical protein